MKVFHFLESDEATTKITVPFYFFYALRPEVRLTGRRSGLAVPELRVGANRVGLDTSELRVGANWKGLYTSELCAEGRRTGLAKSELGAEVRLAGLATSELEANVRRAALPTPELGADVCRAVLATSEVSAEVRRTALFASEVGAEVRLTGLGTFERGMDGRRTGPEVRCAGGLPRLSTLGLTRGMTGGCDGVCALNPRYPAWRRWSTSSTSLAFPWYFWIRSANSCVVCSAVLVAGRRGRLESWVSTGAGRFTEPNGGARGRFAAAPQSVSLDRTMLSLTGRFNSGVERFLGGGVTTRTVARWFPLLGGFIRVVSAGTDDGRFSEALRPSVARFDSDELGSTDDGPFAGGFAFDITGATF